MKKYVMLTLFILTQNLLPFSSQVLKKTYDQYSLKKLMNHNNIPELQEVLETINFDPKIKTKLLFYAVKNNKHDIAELLVNLDVPVAYHKPISPKVEKIITNKSFKPEIAEKIGVGIKDLALVKIVHFGRDKKYHTGQMVVHKKLADEVVEIFTDMCKEKCKIVKIRLIDEYDADDDLSMADNNSCALCQRYITGSKTRYSNHSYGTAIDINPIENPYVNKEKIYPPEGKNFVDRDQNIEEIIKEDDACWLAFTKRNWDWGGSWIPIKGYVDYQHFAKDPSVLEN